MFFTLPEFEVSAAHLAATSPAKCWRGFAHSGVECWFIATLNRDTAEGVLVETICLLFEDDLVPLLQIEADYGRLVGLQRMSINDVGWAIDDVLEVWAGRTSLDAFDEALRYRFDGSDGLTPFDVTVPSGRLFELRLLRSFCDAGCATTSRAD